MKWGAFTCNVCVEQIEQLSLSAEHMLSNAKCAVPRWLWALRTLTAFWGSTVWMLSTFFFRGTQIHNPSIATLHRTGHVGIQPRWFSFSPSSGEYVLLRSDFPLSPRPSFPLSFPQYSRAVQDTYLLIYLISSPVLSGCKRPLSCR